MLIKYYGVVCLATREVHDRLAQPPQSRLIDSVVAKGKSTPGTHRSAQQMRDENFGELAKQYGHAFELYRRDTSPRRRCSFESPPELTKQALFWREVQTT
jgi:hypothetical protein